MSGTPSTSQTCAEVRDDLPAYALGILDADEAARVAAHLVVCPDCRSALRRFETTAGALGAAVTPAAPPPALRDALLREIAAPARETSGDANGARSPLVRFRPLLTVGLGIAAMLALVAAITFGVLFNQMRDQRDAAREGQAEMAEYLKDGGTLSPLLPATGAPDAAQPNHGSLALAPHQDGAMLSVYDLAPSNAERRYLVWAQRAGQGKVTLGELHVDKNGAGWMLLWGPAPMSTYDVVGITRVTADNPQGEPFLTAQMPKPANA